MNEDMKILLEKTEQLHAENESLRRALKDGLEEKEAKTFLKGLGAGVAFTPFALWLAWKLVELIEYAAGMIEIPTGIVGTLAVCFLGGLSLFLYSEVMCRKAKQLGTLLLDSLILVDDEEGGKK